MGLGQQVSPTWTLILNTHSPSDLPELGFWDDLVSLEVLEVSQKNKEGFLKKIIERRGISSYISSAKRFHLFFICSCAWDWESQVVIIT